MSGPTPNQKMRRSRKLADDIEKVLVHFYIYENRNEVLHELHLKSKECFEVRQKTLFENIIKALEDS